MVFQMVLLALNANRLTSKRYLKLKNDLVFDEYSKYGRNEAGSVRHMLSRPVDDIYRTETLRAADVEDARVLEKE